MTTNHHDVQILFTVKARFFLSGSIRESENENTKSVEKHTAYTQMIDLVTTNQLRLLFATYRPNDVIIKIFLCRYII